MKTSIKFLALTMGIITIVACNNNSNNNDFTTETFIKKSQIPVAEGATDSLTITIDLQYPVAKQSNVLVDSITRAIGSIALNDTANMFTLEQAAAFLCTQVESDYISANEEYFKDGSNRHEYAKAAFNWEENIKGKFGEPYKNYQNYAISKYTFTGGAHGYEAEVYMVFDSNSGHKLNLTDVFKDPTSSAITDLLYNNFITQKVAQIKKDNIELPDGLSAEDAAKSILFESTIPATNNFSFSDNGITFLYNPYDIAPYSEGAIGITLSWADLKDLLKIKL